jgi:hypothetical protein
MKNETTWEKTKTPRACELLEVHPLSNFLDFIHLKKLFPITFSSIFKLSQPFKKAFYPQVDN